MKKYMLTFLSLLIILTLSSPVSATLVVRDVFQDAALSIDAFGGSSGNLQTDVAAGSDILAAYLYSADVYGGGVYPVVLNGTTLDPTTDGTLLTPDDNLWHTYVYDVTTLMTSSITGGLQNHTIFENGNNDGEVLAIVYSNPSTVGNTAIIMDGELATASDSTTLNFATPYVSGDLLMSLAISFGNDGDAQYSQVDVTTDSTDNRRLTTSAGGYDDGLQENGALITAGGIGDDASNPNPFATNPTSTPHDDELYNLAMGNSLDASPFISAGDTYLTLDTINPSGDDNIFAMFLSSTFSINDVDDGEDDNNAPVPEPSTWILMGTGLAGLAWYRRRKSA